MNEDEPHSRLAADFRCLPGCASSVFKAIWQTGKLRFSIQNNLDEKQRDTQPDIVDELSARLVCATLAEKRQILICLPDRSPHRGPFLFATALLIESWQRIQTQAHGGQVLYFGSTIGIREQLAKVHIDGLFLDTVFPQSRMRRDLRTERLYSKNKRKQPGSSDSIGSFNLPTVISIYSPGEALEILKQHKAHWLAIDCGDEIRLRWSRQIVEYAQLRNIPLIAWTQNSLSHIIEEFRSAGGMVFSWPALKKNQSVPAMGPNISSGLQQIFDTTEVNVIKPVIIEQSESLDHLRQAYRQLSQAAQVADSATKGRLLQSTFQVSWKYLRSLEHLSIPLDLFESEVASHWGISSFEKTCSTLDKYLDAQSEQQSNVLNKLAEVKYHLRAAHEIMRNQAPPLWNILPGICMDTFAPGTFRVLIFPTKAHKRMFLLALLAYYNVTEDELGDVGISITSLAEVYDFLTVSYQEEEDADLQRIITGIPINEELIDFWLVGLPSWESTPRIEPLLRRSEFHIVLYDYQIPTLARRTERWAQILYPSPNNVWGNIPGLFASPTSSLDTSSRLVVHEIDKFRLTRSGFSKRDPHTESTTTTMELWEPFDPVEEFAILIEADSSTEGTQRDSDGVLTSATHDQDNDDFVDYAWCITFETGDYVLLAPDEKVNVIIHSHNQVKTDERFASALRSGDKIVFIHGQRRQSLLSLVISRVYRNPAVNLHVKLVERWQEDFASAHQKRQLDADNIWNLEELFSEMKQRGSQISDSQPLRNWLRGETLRPQDAEDLRRLGEIFEIEFLKQNYKRIHRAGARLAGLHVSLSRRLNAWLSSDAPDLVADMGNQNDIIDEQLGLTFQDFRDSLAILQISSIRRETGPFIRDMLGQLGRRDDS